MKIIGQGKGWCWGMKKRIDEVKYGRVRGILKERMGEGERENIC